MRAADIIRKKRDGSELSREEIAYLIRDYCRNKIPDYQISAFLMAVFFRGLTEAETVALTQEMEFSGAVFDLSSIAGRKVDKHSTGGVGDKTSLIVAPAVAAAGVVVPMICGRGLGHTGGTLDKLESIPGFNVQLSGDNFREMLSTVGAALIGQTEDIVPADRKLYALRDVTSTVESLPLIVASIMSKKLAEGVDGLVLDVKTGSGAFMKTRQDAERLARAMVGIGKACGKKMAALITDMNQPLGKLVGNALEVRECIDVLKGGGPADLVSLCEELSAHCLVLGEAAPGIEEARELYRRSIASGSALEKFRAIIRFQGGNESVVDDDSILPKALYQTPLLSSGAGFVLSMDTEAIGLALCALGAGRENVDSSIDPAAGMYLHKKLGDFVEAGEPLCTLYYNEEKRFREAAPKIEAAYVLAFEPPPKRSELILEIL
jgi:pyrimidine-nucleoside phosphorylase